MDLKLTVINIFMTITKKTAVALLFPIIIVIASAFPALAGATAVVGTLTIGSQSAAANDVITVPVTANITNIQAIQLSINYPESVLKYIGCSSTHVVCSTDVASSTDKINLTWFDVSNFLTVNNETLLSLQFEVISSSVSNTVLSFTPTEVIDGLGTDVTGSFAFNSGTLTLNPAATLSSIAITTPADKLTYTVGETLDLAGLVVTGTYSDSSTQVESITVDDVSGFDSSAPATDQVLTITVGGQTTTYTIDVVASISSAKAITTFNFTTPAATGVIDETAHTVEVTVPFGTSVTALVPTIVVSTGASVSPNTGVAQNFTTPATYTVTAENASTQDYAVTVIVAPNTATNILSFDSTSPVSVGVISGTDITLTVPFGTSLVDLPITISLSSGASVLPAAGNTTFVDGVATIYTVTAQDAITTQNYSVTVAVAASSAKDITSFNFAGLTPSVTGIVTGTDIALNVPFGTDVTTLVPTIGITGASVSPTSGTAQDFSSPVTYTVTAADATTQEYTVTVAVADPSDITALTEAITVAQNKHNAAVEGNLPGQYPAPLKSNLQTAINTASAITEASTQSVVDDAVTTLNAAVDTFEAGKVVPSSLTDLNTAIASAQDVVSAATVGTNYGEYSQASVDTLNAAITTAQGIDDTMAQSVVNAAVVTLNNAISAFQASVVPTPDKAALTTSIATAQTAYDAATPIEGATHGNRIIGAHTTLQSAIDAATAVNISTTATQSDVDAEKSTLDTAVTTFNAAIVPTPTVVALTASIDAATTAITGAIEGVNHGEYAAGSIATFQTAIDTATGVKNSNTATQSDVDAAKSTLDAALTTFQSVQVPTPNITALTASITVEVGAVHGTPVYVLTETDYTAGSWSAYTSAITSAISVETDTSSTQTEVNDAATAVATTKTALVFVGQAALNTAVATAGALTEADYTSASWATLTTALALPHSTNALTITKTTAINSAISGLVLSVQGETLTLIVTTSGDKASTTISSATQASTVSGGITTTLDIPSGTVITGPSTWDGTLTLPVATTTFTLTANSGNTASAALAIEVGAGDISLTFDQAVKLTFAGQAGKLIGWSQAGVFHQITTTCDSSTSPTLAAGADCKIDVGSDLIVWTKHFSVFVVYTETVIPAPSPASGGGNGPPVGSGYGGAPVALALANTNNGGAVPTGGSTTGIGTGGQVLGAAAYNFSNNLTVGSTGNDVTELQKVLIAEGYLSIAAPTSYFGALTKAAVIKYQAAHGISPQSGYVGPLTRAQLNLSTTAVMSDEQINTLIAQLTAHVQSLTTQFNALVAARASSGQ
ncbi:MAG: hypothetical protein A2749_01675 [Parcubacteria group bacterium RIFCSPHIGHO2_01_FULL_45_26]|nr:MAG: hypothetical protein A2749_01675 [Parcubacteria group bacterium RIFCSPHIGHO2_01_FULL_45_26]